MWPIWPPSTLYFRTQAEAYSYEDRMPSLWNPIVGARATFMQPILYVTSHG